MNNRYANFEYSFFSFFWLWMINRDEKGFKHLLGMRIILTNWENIDRHTFLLFSHLCKIHGKILLTQKMQRMPSYFSLIFSLQKRAENETTTAQRNKLLLGKKKNNCIIAAIFCNKMKWTIQTHLNIFEGAFIVPHRMLNIQWMNMNFIFRFHSIPVFLWSENPKDIQRREEQRNEWMKFLKKNIKYCCVSWTFFFCFKRTWYNF